MGLGARYIRISYYLVVLVLIFGALITWTAPDLKSDDKASLGDQVNNVRVLNTFQGGSFSNYANVDEMTRWSGILAQRIAERVAKQQMPNSPPPATRPANSRDIGGSQEAVPARMGRAPVLEQSPVAWSIKVVNQQTSFLPQLREEVIVLFRYAPEYFQGNAFTEGTWVLAHLRNSIHQGTDIPSIDPVPEVSLGRWNVAETPKLLDPGAPESSRLERMPNIHTFISRPTVRQIAEFVHATDFGNNDVYSTSSVSRRMDVDVLRVVVYPEYAILADAFVAT